MRRHLLIATFITAILVGVLHRVSLALTLYWTYWWLDVVMHVLGGIVIGLLVLTFFAYRTKHIELVVDMKIFVFTLGAMLLIAVGWEIFEFFTNPFVSAEPFPDTAHDLFAGVAGGAIAYTYAYGIHIRHSGSVNS